MPRQDPLPLHSLVWRWAAGMGLISWRYLWSTIPLHRVEVHDDSPRLPPDLPLQVSTADMQPWQCGVGPMYHRLFRVRIADARADADGLMSTVIGDFGSLVPREVVRVRRGTSAGRPLAVGDDMVVDMPGPWNGPVRVVDAERTRLRLATLQGHLEAGQIEFRAFDGDTADDPLTFQIETWARAADRRVQLLYSSLRLAKEIQLNMWVRFCQAAAAAAGGRCDDGVRIRTTVTPAPGASR